jgi:galactokinase
VTSPDVAAPDWHEPGALDERAAALADAFRRRHGRPPAGVWAAPGRVNVIGEHVDYAGGLCLPLALPHTTLVAASPGPAGRVHAASHQRPDEPVDVALDDVGPGTPQGWGAYVAGVPAALGVRAGLTALVDSTVPVGAGLSSSAALSCATALAVDGLAGLGLAADDAGRAQLAAACVRAENDVALAPTGGMDQAAALRCTAGAALLLDCRDGAVRHVPLELGRHDLVLLAVDTRADHAHADGQYGRRRAGVEQAARELGVPLLRDLEDEDVDAVLSRVHDAALRPLVRHVLTETARVRQAADVLRDDSPLALGPLLEASHASLRDDLQVSCPELDLAVDTATAAGAVGARMTGGGFGGSAVALVPNHLVEGVVAAVAAAFARARLDPPAFLLAEPSAAGRRVC